MAIKLSLAPFRMHLPSGCTIDMPIELPSAGKYRFLARYFIISPQEGCKVLCVLMSASITRKPHSQTLPNFLCMLPVAMVLLRRRCDTSAYMYTFGFVNDIVFACNGHNQAQYYVLKKFARWRYLLDGRQLNFGRVHHSGHLGEVCYLRLAL